MLDHFSISVHNFEDGLKFYDNTLDILGYKRLMTFDMPEKQVQCAGYGHKDKPSFWISGLGKAEENVGCARGVHIAFLAPSIHAVHEWYTKCLELGGKDNGAPGLRPEYHPGYYGAFVIDPNGWRIEACLHNASGQ